MLSYGGAALGKVPCQGDGVRGTDWSSVAVSLAVSRSSNRRRTEMSLDSG